MAKHKSRILVVDDEPKYLNIIQLNLEARGYEVLLAQDGQTAIELTAAENPDLIILDVRMAGIDGFEVCRRVRQFSTVPIIMLTALVEDVNKIKGLDLGADDYVAKPFSITELLARIRAALRRVELEAQPGGAPVFQAGDLQVDLVQQRVFIKGEEISLTSIEFRLLKELVKHSGRIVVSDRLLEAVWGIEYLGEDRILRQAVYRLRQKIEPDSKDPQYIQTRTGLGYILTAPDYPAS